MQVKSLTITSSAWLGPINETKTLESYIDIVKDNVPETARLVESFKLQKDDANGVYQYVARYQWNNGADIRIFLFKNKAGNCYLEFDVYSPCDYVKETANGIFIRFTGSDEHIPMYSYEYEAYVIEINFGKKAVTNTAEITSRKIFDALMDYFDMYALEDLTYDTEFGGYIGVVASDTKDCAIRVEVKEVIYNGEAYVAAYFYVSYLNQN